MLGSQNFSGRHQGTLTACIDGGEQRSDGHNGFATANITLNQPCHRLLPHQISANLCQYALLRAGERKGQQIEESGQ